MISVIKKQDHEKGYGESINREYIMLCIKDDLGFKKIQYRMNFLKSKGFIL